MDDLAGKVWVQWGALLPRQQRRIRRRHPHLAEVLDAAMADEQRNLVAMWAGIQQRLGR